MLSKGQVCTTQRCTTPHFITIINDTFIKGKGGRSLNRVPFGHGG